MPSAFVTLVTSDPYVEGAITLAHSLRTVHSIHDTIVLVPAINAISALPLARLYRAFHKVVYVDILRSGSAPSDDINLGLLNRPELDITYTKLHVFNPHILPSYDKICFLDADTLVLKNVDHLFGVLNRVDFAASPDVGWPDIFNSGVFLARPNKEVYEALMWDALYSGSFDGGDQGLLNSFFDTWAGNETLNYVALGREATSSGSGPRPYCCPDKKRTGRLPFIYNVTPSAVYSYLPAFNHFKSHIAIVHFAGHAKPWNQKRFTDGTVWNSQLAGDAIDLHTAWWNIYESLTKLWISEDKHKIPFHPDPNPVPATESSTYTHLHYEWDRAELPSPASRPNNYDWDNKELPSSLDYVLPAQSHAYSSHKSRSKSKDSRKPSSKPVSPLKIFSAEQNVQTPFQDPRYRPVSGSPTKSPNSAGSSPQKGNETKYEWDVAEFTPSQRRLSAVNMPVMAPQLTSRASSANGSNGSTSNATARLIPSLSQAPKNESHESLYDEEGYSLHPTKKE